MAYNETKTVESNLAYGFQLDAFGRLRTSQPNQRLDVEFAYDKQPEYFDEITNGSGATVTHNGNTRDVTLTVGSTTNGEFSKMASYPVPYTPGNSQLISITGVLDLADIGTGTCEVFLRSKISGTVADLTTIEESSWLIDSAGIDWSKSHIFQIDFQSLKVGSIRFALDQNGTSTQIAQINNDNLRNSGYWQLPNQPVYYHIYNSGGNTIMELGYGSADNAIGFRYTIAANASATMKAICCTVKSEGGYNIKELPGLPHSVDMGISTTTVSTTLVPIISIKPRSTFQSFDNHVICLPIEAFLQTDESIRFAIIHEATLTGAVWANVDTVRSSVEYDTTATAISGGHVVYSDYLYALTSGAKGTTTVGSKLTQGLLGKSVLWNRLSGNVSGSLTLAAIRNSGTDAAVQGGFRWEELR